MAIEAVGDYNLARYTTTNSTQNLLIGYGSYMGLLVLFIQSIKKMGLAWSNWAWDGWSNIATGAVALFILGERPSGKELLGMGLITAGLFLLGLDGTKRAK